MVTCVVCLCSKHIAHWHLEHSTSIIDVGSMLGLRGYFMNITIISMLWILRWSTSILYCYEYYYFIWTLFLIIGKLWGGFSPQITLVSMPMKIATFIQRQCLFLLWRLTLWAHLVIDRSQAGKTNTLPKASSQHTEGSHQWNTQFTICSCSGFINLYPSSCLTLRVALSNWPLDQRTSILVTFIT